MIETIKARGKHEKMLGRGIIMKIEDIKRLQGKVVTDEELIELEANENVNDVRYNGYTRLYYRKQWFTLQLVDETEVDIYV